jgi:AraC family transcriptional regulator of adaptative response/methylated-DNA-[protein]-cysteine methyltransferase
MNSRPENFAMTHTTTGIEADPRWALLRARDPAADGRFVYAVRTTGVFCRPACPSRLAKPANLAFYDTPAAAQAAGYRPCLRCRPLAVDAPHPMTARMQALAAFIEAHADEALPLARLGREAGLSPSHTQRAFTAVLGSSPKDFQAAARLRRLKAGLRAGEDVLGATFGAGYGSTSRIYELVDAGLGMTPSAYRAGGAGEVIVHAVRQTALGLLMMAATARGVCSVSFGEDAAALEAGLRAEFPRATLRPAEPAADGALAAWMAALDEHLSRGAPRPDLPLTLRGTAFQIRVWRFLLRVKAGDVVSYSELARGVGAPRAVRAAASACAANRVAVLVPCHRALRADGGLGGYRWGLARKQALLAAERGARP